MKLAQQSGEDTYGGKDQYMRGMPVPEADGNSTRELEILVARNLQRNRRIGAVKTPQERTMLQRQIDATDKQIDQLVYQLYGLTEEEIRIIEGK